MKRADPTSILTRRQLLWRLGALGVTATAALTAACQQGTPAAPAGGAQAGGAPAGGAQKAPAKPASASGELKVWMSGAPELEQALTKILQEYKADKPNLTLTVENFPFNQYSQKLTTSFAGGTGPDVYWIDVRAVEFAKRGALLPLDPFVSKEYTDDLFPVTLEAGEWNGKRYAVPMHELANGLFVNKAMFEKAGITVPRDLKDAWTWDQLREYSMKLAERSGGTTNVWGFGHLREPGDWTVLPFIHQNGGQPLSPDYKKASGFLNAEPAVEALSWYGKLYTEDKVASASLPPDAFPTGKVAIFDAVSIYVVPLQRQHPNFQYEVAPAPKKKQMAVMTGGYNVGINPATKQPQELCWDLIDYMTRVKHAQWALESGYLPARKSVIEGTPMYKEHPWKLFLDELAQAGIHRPASTEYSFFFDTFGATVTDIVTGADVKASLDKAASVLDPRLAAS